MIEYEAWVKRSRLWAIVATAKPWGGGLSRECRFCVRACSRRSAERNASIRLQWAKRFEIVSCEEVDEAAQALLPLHDAGH